MADDVLSNLEKKYKFKPEPINNTEQQTFKTGTAKPDMLSELEQKYKPTAFQRFEQGAGSAIASGIPAAVESAKNSGFSSETASKALEAMSSLILNYGVPAAAGFGMAGPAGAIAGLGAGAITTAGLGGTGAVLEPHIKELQDSNNSAIEQMKKLPPSMGGPINPKFQIIDLNNPTIQKIAPLMASLLLKKNALSKENLTQFKPFEDVKTINPLSQEAEMSKNMGIDFSQSAEAMKTGVGGSKLQGIEAITKVSPKTENQWRNFNTNQKQQINDAFFKIAGEEARLTPEQVNIKLADKLSKQKEFGGVSKGEIMEYLDTQKVNMKVVKTEIASVLEKYSRALPKSARNKIAKAIDDAEIFSKTNTSVADLEYAKQRLGLAVKDAFSGLVDKGAIKALENELYGVLKSNAEKQAAIAMPEAAQALSAANKQISELKRVIGKTKDTDKGSASLFKKALTESTEAEIMQKYAPEELQKSGMSFIKQEIFDTNGNINNATLKIQLKDIGDIKGEAIFGKQKWQDLKDLSKVIDFVEAPTKKYMDLTGKVETAGKMALNEAANIASSGIWKRVKDYFETASMQGQAKDFYKMRNKPIETINMTEVLKKSALSQISARQKEGAK